LIQPLQMHLEHFEQKYRVFCEAIVWPLTPDARKRRWAKTKYGDCSPDYRVDRATSTCNCRWQILTTTRLTDDMAMRRAAQLQCQHHVVRCPQILPNKRLFLSDSPCLAAASPHSASDIRR
jgi:hypothetical protein